MKQVNVEALLAKKEQISNAAIKSAMKRLEEERTKQFEEKLIGFLDTVQSNTASAVESLRSIRAKEKAIKAYLVVIAEAEQNFFKDADTENYNRAITSAFMGLMSALRYGSGSSILVERPAILQS